MKVGFDIDGVLANFADSFNAVLADVADRPKPSRFGEPGPTKWAWYEDYDTTPEQLVKAWKRVKESTDFWFGLDPLANMERLANAWSAIPKRHDIYFITDRPGKEAKFQTENWLKHRLGKSREITVLISKDKAGLAKSLELDFYIDDKPENVNAVAGIIQTPGLMSPVAMLQGRRYNDEAAVLSNVQVVSSIAPLIQIIS